MTCRSPLRLLYCTTVYDVTRRDTLDAIAQHWLPEVSRYCTFPDAVKMVVGNKIDMVGGIVSSQT